MREQVDEQTMKLWPTPNAWDGNRGRGQGEFDREESSDQLDFSSEGCRTSDRFTCGRHQERGLQGWSSIPPSVMEEKESQLGNSSRVYTDEGIWFAEPNVGRVALGYPKMDRLKGLGAIVPQIAMQIGLAIKVSYHEKK